jgi:hypothetical protein
VTYVCRRRTTKGQSPVSEDGVYFSIGFEIVDEDARRELGKKGGGVAGFEEDGGESQQVQEVKEQGEKAMEDIEQSDDID